MDEFCAPLKWLKTHVVSIGVGAHLFTAQQPVSAVRSGLELKDNRPLRLTGQHATRHMTTNHQAYHRPMKMKRRFLLLLKARVSGPCSRRHDLKMVSVVFGLFVPHRSQHQALQPLRHAQWEKRACGGMQKDQGPNVLLRHQSMQ